MYSTKSKYLGVIHDQRQNWNNHLVLKKFQSFLVKDFVTKSERLKKTKNRRKLEKLERLVCFGNHKSNILLSYCLNGRATLAHTKHVLVKLLFTVIEKQINWLSEDSTRHSAGYFWEKWGPGQTNF